VYLHSFLTSGLKGDPAVHTEGRVDGSHCSSGRFVPIRILCFEDNWIIDAVNKMLLSPKSGNLCGNASEPPVAVHRFRIVSTVTSGSCFLIITVDSLTCNMMWRQEQITANCSVAADCSERPASLTDVWTYETLIFPSILQDRSQELWMLVRSASPSWCHCFGYEAKIFFFPTSRAVFLFRHAYSLLFHFHDCDWPQAFQPSYTIANFLISITSSATEI